MAKKKVDWQEILKFVVAYITAHANGDVQGRKEALNKIKEAQNG
jgi:hypothetical protein